MNERIKFVKNYLNWETEKEKGLKHGCRTKLVTRVNKFQKKDTQHQQMKMKKTFQWKGLNSVAKRRDKTSLFSNADLKGFVSR